MNKVCPLMIVGKNAVQIKSPIDHSSVKGEFLCIGKLCASYRKEGIAEWCGLSGRLTNEMTQDLAKDKFAKANHSKQQEQTVGDAAAARRRGSGA